MTSLPSAPLTVPARARRQLRDAAENLDREEARARRAEGALAQSHAQRGALAGRVEQLEAAAARQRVVLQVSSLNHPPARAPERAPPVRALPCPAPLYKTQTASRRFTKPRFLTATSLQAVAAERDRAASGLSSQQEALVAAEAQRAALEKAAARVEKERAAVEAQLHAAEQVLAARHAQRPTSSIFRDASLRDGR